MLVLCEVGFLVELVLGPLEGLVVLKGYRSFGCQRETRMLLEKLEHFYVILIILIRNIFMNICVCGVC